MDGRLGRSGTVCRQPRDISYSGTRFSGCYFLLQALAVAAWWSWLTLAPANRTLFLPSGELEPELLAFLLPDLTVIVAASATFALLFFKGSPWLVPVGWFAAGSMVYSTIYCLSWAFVRGGGWLSVVLMLPGALLSVVAAIDGSIGVAPIFRRATQASMSRHVLATAAQIVVLWSIFLFLVPGLLVELEDQLAWNAPLSFSGQRVIASIVFAVFSGVGLASGWTMSRRGDGTPLPFDSPNRLVVAGPYAHVRNPMIIAGLGQGAAVALWFGSWLATLYVVLGGAIWQFLVRPAEERQLFETFGDKYVRYRDQVRCWLPRLRPYSGRSPGVR